MTLRKKIVFAGGLLIGAFAVAGAATSQPCTNVAARADTDMPGVAPEPSGGWKSKGVVVAAPAPKDVGRFCSFVKDMLKPAGVDTIVLLVRYRYKFTSHPECAAGNALSLADVKAIKAACDKSGVRLIPKMNLLGHQGEKKGVVRDGLLKGHPELDESEGRKSVALDYCRCLCPTHTDSKRIVLDLVDELVDAFGADMVHIGCDEVFEIGKCPRCRGTATAKLFADWVNGIADHLKAKGVGVMMWGDRLLDSKAMGYGAWEASYNGTCDALGKVNRDVVICDWHYSIRKAYPSVEAFADAGYKMYLCPWRYAESTQKFLEYAVAHDKGQYLGVLLTTWCACEDFMDVVEGKGVTRHEPDSKTAKTLVALGRNFRYLFPKAPAPAGDAPATAEFNSNWPVRGKRVVNINTVVRVNQIEVSRTANRGRDEAHKHTVEAVETFRKAVSDAIPEAKVTWAFSWLALHDQRPNYAAIRKRVVEYHRQYGDEITFIPGAYFAPMYNSREQTNRDIHDGLKLVGEMVGGGYRPHGIVAGFLAADNLRFLAEEEGIHVAQGTIWSQYGIDNGDGDGSISYPYYPSREHACKAAQGKDDFIDCVNLDGWTCDFLCARKFGFEGGGNSRTGVGPIETYARLGVENGLKESLAVVRSHFGDNFSSNGFGWIVVNWEISLVKGYKPEVTAAMTTWLKEIRKEFPDAVVPLMSEFGEAWRRENPNNDKLDYRFVQRGTGVTRLISEPNMEIRWYMNKKFRLATLRDWTKDEPEMVIDFTRYDVRAKEPPDASVEKPSRNWSLVNRINQKRRRPEDAPIPLSALTDEERRLVNEYCHADLGGQKK